MDDEVPKVGIAELAEKAKLTLLRAATCLDDEDFEDAGMRLAVAVAQVEHIRFLVNRYGISMTMAQLEERRRRHGAHLGSGGRIR